jgi:ABC-2 type transport system permease protein
MIPGHGNFAWPSREIAGTNAAPQAMRIFRILLMKELKGYFLTPFGWVVLGFVTVMQGVSLSTAMKGFRDSPVKDSLVYVTFHTPVFWFYFLFIFPLITMRLFAEEERSGTLETLLTAPVRTWQVVLSKYGAAMVFYSILWLPCLVQFKLFEWFTDLPPAWTPGAMLGTFAILMLMGAAFTAIGCLASALTSSQIVAGILTIGILVIQYFMGFVTVIWGESFAGAPLFHHISAQQHLHYFASGLLDTRPLVYHLGIAVFVLGLTYHVVDYRRWRN